MSLKPISVGVAVYGEDGSYNAVFAELHRPGSLYPHQDPEFVGHTIYDEDDNPQDAPFCLIIKADRVLKELYWTFPKIFGEPERKHLTTFSKYPM